MRKYCLRLIIASCLTPPSSALGMDAFPGLQVDTAGQAAFGSSSHTPVKPQMSPGGESCASSVAMTPSPAAAFSGRLSSAVPYAHSVPCAQATGTGHGSSAVSFFTPSPVCDTPLSNGLFSPLASLSPVALSADEVLGGPIKGFDFTQQRPASPEELMFCDLAIKKLRGKGLDRKSLTFLMETLQSNIDLKTRSKIARKIYAYTSGYDKAMVEHVLKAGFSIDNPLKTAQLLSLYGGSENMKYYNYLYKIYNNEFNPLKERIQAGDLLFTLTLSNFGHNFISFVRHGFENFGFPPEDRIIAGQTYLGFAAPDEQAKIRAFWEGISNNRLDSNQSLALKMLLKHGDDAQKDAAAMKYMTVFLLSPAGNVSLLKKAFKHSTLEGKRTLLSSIQDYVKDLDGDISTLEISSLALMVCPNVEFFEDILFQGFNASKLSLSDKLHAALFAFSYTDRYKAASLAFVLSTFDADDSAAIDTLKKMLVLDGVDDLNAFLITRMHSSPAAQQLEIANILLKWGNHDAANRAASVLMIYHSHSTSKDEQLTILKDIYRYGNEPQKDQAYTLLLKEFMTETVFEKRLNIAKTVLEFGTETQKEVMKRELLPLMHSLDHEQIGKLLSVFEDFGTKDDITSMLPVLAAKTAYFESNPHLSLKFATILYDMGNDTFKDLAYKVALQVFAKHFDILSAHLMNDPLSIYKNLAKESVSYALGGPVGYKGERVGGKGTDVERKLAQELIFNISVFDPLYAVQNQHKLLEITKMLLDEDPTDPKRIFSISKRFVKIADNTKLEALTTSPLLKKARDFVEQYKHTFHDVN